MCLNIISVKLCYRYTWGLLRDTFVRVGCSTPSCAGITPFCSSHSHWVTSGKVPGRLGKIVHLLTLLHDPGIILPAIGPHNICRVCDGSFDSIKSQNLVELEGFDDMTELAKKCLWRSRTLLGGKFVRHSTRKPAIGVIDARIF